MGSYLAHMDIAAAVAWLASHVNREVDPSAAAAARRLEGISAVLSYLDDPQASYPVVHLTGTNGKGSTARMVAALLAAHGLSVGTYTSPHLERLNERLAWSGRPIPDDDLAEQLSAIAQLEPVLPEPLTHFEVLTAAAFRWFADVAVDVAVVEVGLGGRWDSTNVADAAVAVVTNVALDHAETIGPTLADIAAEKAGIVKPDSFLVLGESDEELAATFAQRPSAGMWQRGPDFGVTANRLAVGGRSVDLYSAGGAAYDDLFLPLHGAFQGDNASAAVAAAQAFFGHPLDGTLVRAALGAVEVPGRMEVVGREPLVVIDGAHNPAGAEAASASLAEAFGHGPRILVVGMLVDRDPVEMLTALRAAEARAVIATTASSPRALPAEDIVAAAATMGIIARAAGSVAEAVAAAVSEAGAGGTVFIAGSLYVAGPARAALVTGGGMSARSARPDGQGPRPRS